VNRSGNSSQWVQWLETRKNFRFPAQAKNFLFPQRFNTGYGNHPASYSMGIGAFSSGVKRPARKASHSPPSSTGLKMSAAVPLTSHTPWRWCAEFNTGTTSHSPFGVDMADKQG
jgi:hypothetical protein